MTSVNGEHPRFEDATSLSPTIRRLRKFSTRVNGKAYLAGNQRRWHGIRADQVGNPPPFA